MEKTPYSNIAGRSFRIVFNNMVKNNSNFFSIFPIFHFECTIKICYFFFTIFTLYYNLIYEKRPIFSFLIYNIQLGFFPIFFKIFHFF